MVHGHGLARTRETGSGTALGRIGKALEAVVPEQTPLQAETRRVVRLLAISGIVLCAVLALAYGLTRGNWLEGLLASLTLAMAIIPNEFPVVLTLFLSLGAWRLSRAHLLTRRIPAIETLGATTVLCVDKTGTLTLNQMSVAMLAADGRYLDLTALPSVLLPEEDHTLVEFAILASQQQPLDPIDRALRDLGDKHLAQTEHIHDDWSLVQEYPLSPQLLALSRV